ncbi:MAG: M20/M25/M40 family metallo-hydrolase, partial [Mogibacterium sp.]|nr:M20/M25/M40 family metallo-hydrolase [Mogibacterium sp.]
LPKSIVGDDANFLLKVNGDSMIDAGILKNPTVDAAMGFHMNFGPLGDFDLHPGCMSYAPGQMMFSADEFKITVKGRMAHGSSAFQGVSAVNAASLIANTFNSVLALEIPCDEAALLIVGAIQSGNAGNIIPDTATIIGSFRAYTVETREFIRQRVEDITMGIARATRTTATIEYTASVAPVVNNKELAAEMVGYCEEVMDKVQAIPPVKGSEDFANLGLHVPIFFANVCAGDPSDGYAYGMHNPKARISEDALPYGVAAHCNCAVNWLANHSK